MVIVTTTSLYITPYITIYTLRFRINPNSQGVILTYVPLLIPSKCLQILHKADSFVRHMTVIQGTLCPDPSRLYVFTLSSNTHTRTYRYVCMLNTCTVSILFCLMNYTALYHVQPHFYRCVLLALFCFQQIC